jgi:pimeloyl-ACP methyl ester carboxylesterase
MLAFVESGSGPAVLLLHGIPGNGRTWRRVSPLLENDCRLIAPDFLGFGDSPEPRDDGHAVEQAEAVDALLWKLGIDRVHVVGFDFGGPVAIELYRRGASRFASLTLVATNVVTDNPVPPPLRLAKVPGIGELLFLATCSTAGLALMRRGAPVERFSRRERRSTRTIFLRSIRHLREIYQPIEELLPALRIPVSVVWAANDPFFSVEAGRATAARIPGAELTLLARCGHFVPEERPEELALAIRSTIERTRVRDDVREEPLEMIAKRRS